MPALILMLIVMPTFERVGFALFGLVLDRGRPQQPGLR
jgi:hypothetical protein